MSRWIDIDDAIEIVTKIQGMWATTLHALCDAPSIDLVRCGECKYWGNSYICWRRRAKPIAMNPDDFCSYGMRKESE